MMEDVAIDFRQLMKQEKRRAREKRRQEKGKSEESDKVKSVTQDISSKNDITDMPSLDNWPSNWLSNNTISKTQFSPEYTFNKPETVTYMRTFLQQEQQARLMDWLQALPESSSQQTSSETTSNNIYNKWNTMKYAKRRVCMFQAPLPLPLQQLSNLLVSLEIFPYSHPPNHVLINEYTASQGILPHTDGPLYYPKTATISIGEGEVLLNFQKRLSTDQVGLVENPVILQVLLESGSLVVFEKDAYTKHTHGIQDVLVEYASLDCGNASEETRVARGHRISLTFRHKYKLDE